MDTEKLNSEMKETDLCQFPATTLARMIRERRLSAVEVVQAHLERIDMINPVVNSVIQIAPESALDRAKEADAAISRGEAAGPLHGVPFTVKDVYEVRDCARLVTAKGMVSRPGQPARRDSTAIERLTAAGGVLIGVTKATWEDREELYGPTHNPYDFTRSPGISSGGEAATIAACGSPLGMGSDSGGSLRMPAHFCGTATIRPSNGRVPRSADAGIVYDSRTVSGPLARTVDDVAVALRVVSGMDWRDPSTLPVPLADWRAVALKGLRVALFTDNGIVSATPDIVVTIQSAAAALEGAGMIVEEARPPGLDNGWDLTREYWNLDDRLRLDAYSDFMRRWYVYRVRMADFMRKRDLILCPVEAFTAPLLSGDDRRGPGFTYTAPFSLVGWPAATVRAGTSPEGLPIGVQLVAGSWRDDVALAAAAAVECASGGWQPPPPHSFSNRILPKWDDHRRLG